MKVSSNVYVVAADGAHYAWLRPGDTVPDWADVSNPDVLVAEDEPDKPAESYPPAPAPAKKRPARKPAAD